MSHLFSLSRRAFTIVEVIVSLFILALVAAVSITIIVSRDTARDATAAIGAAPSAIDTLQASLEGQNVVALNAEIAAGNAIYVVYRSAGTDAAVAPWRTLDSTALPDSLGAEGPVYVAALSNVKLYDKSRAVDFDVALGWIAPGLATESAASLKARLGKAQKLCAYKVIVLAK